MRAAFVTENDNEQLSLVGVSHNVICICYEIRRRIQSWQRTHLACYRLLEKCGYDICQCPTECLRERVTTEGKLYYKL